MSGGRRIVVVGAGVIGVTTAQALLADGHEVTLLEARGSAAAGTSQANGGFLSAAFCAPWAVPGLPRQAMAALFDRQAPFRWRPDGSLDQLRWLRALIAQCDAAQFARHRRRMVRLALLSRVCLQGVLVQTGLEVAGRGSGVLQLFRRAPGESLIRQRLDELRGQGFDAHWCGPEQVQALEPGLRADAGVVGALQVRDDGCGDCAVFVQGLLGWCQARGLRVVLEAPVQALEVDAGGRRLRAVRARGQRWAADAFVFATGVDTPRLLRPHLAVPLLPVKGYSISVPVADGQGVRGAVIDDASKLAVTRLGAQLRLAGMADVVGHDLRVDAARCAQLVRQHEALFGPLPHERRLWAGLRPMTPDGTPIIGATPIEGLYLNTGHGTFGWTMACGSARLLVDLIAGRPAPLEPQAYALDPAARARD